ncbi:hypothetical protein AAU61_10040 [Desulfocarbo indianensis]|nr:hypothetical protein AAU61_10040 [Desulfocarbo indianensis]
MSQRRTAEIWPSHAALAEELSRRARASAGLLFSPPFFTFDSLLPKLLAQAPLPGGKEPLLPLAGPILVQGLLRGESQQDIYAGLAAGRRFPERLWRLLVEVKAAGLGHGDLRALSAEQGPRLQALARLLGDYQAALDARGLADQADQLSALEAMLERGQTPGLISGWQKIICRQVLWLRTLDLRLLRALAQVVEVRVEFAMTTSWGGQGALRGLLDATAAALEAEPQHENLGVSWHDLRGEGGPLKDLAASHLDGALPYNGQGEERVELVRAAGRYGLAEALARRALELVQEGMPPHEIALVFPDLEVYGPMVADAAARLGLPLSFDNGLPLAKSPPALAFLNLLELPLAGYPRQALAQALASPYLAGFMHSLAPEVGGALLSQAGHLLKKAGYLDARDVPASQWLARSAGQARTPGESKKYLKLSELCNKLEAKLTIYSQQNNLIDYLEYSIQLLADLRLAEFLANSAGEKDARLAIEAVKVRDLTTLRDLSQALQGLEQAARQAGAREALAPGRLLALLKEVLGGVPLSQTNVNGAGGYAKSSALGVAVYRLMDTMGVKPRAALIGGLNQGEFPRRPQGQNLLSSADRLALGKKARRPVWRTDDEEYESQVLVLAWLLANCQERAVLGAASADLTGREQQPAFIMDDLARLLDRPLPPAQGGVFGELPSLAKVLEPLALWGRIAANSLQPAQADSGLAQAALWSLAQAPALAGHWQDLAGRAAMEEKRRQLNALDLGARARAGDAFSGLIRTPQALALLRLVLAQPQKRELSPSRLEAYASCPLAWYFSYLLGIYLVSEPGWVLEPRSEGEWVHRTLALFFDPGEFNPEWDAGQCAERLAQCLERAKEELSAGLAAPPAVWEARGQALFSALSQVVTREMQDLAGSAAPLAVEHDIGTEGKGLSIQVDEGPPLKLKGRLDRLDRGPGLAVVSDYKHTANDKGLREATDKELAGHSQFQLPVYLAAARELLGGEGDLTLTGRLVPTLLASRQPDQMIFQARDAFLAADPAERQRLAQAGIPNLFNLIADLWQELSSGCFAAQPDRQTCQYCDYRLACRTQAPEAEASQDQPGPA